MKHFILIVLALVSVSCAAGSAQRESFREWKEEVKLNDGRVIVVSQKKRCEGAYTGQDYAPCIAREAWLIINLPEFSQEPIIWHENLHPVVLNLSKGQFYLVADFPTQKEFRMYGEPKPSYICFKLNNATWERISFEQVPKDIYEVNMLLEGIPPNEITYLSIEKKESSEVNGKITYREWQKHLDTSHSW